MDNVEIKSKFNLEDRVIIKQIAQEPQKAMIVEIRTKLYRSIISGSYTEIQSHEYGVKLGNGSFRMVEAEHIYKDG